MAILEFANDILVDFNGNKAYLTDNELFIRDTSDDSVVPGYLQTNESDLGEPTLDKLLNMFDIDYKGQIEVWVYLDNVKLVELTTTLSATRTTQYLYMPLAYRRPFQKLKLVFYTENEDTILYGIEVDFQVLKRRKV